MSDDLAKRFAKEAPSGHPNVTPRDAATLILLDRSGKVPKVLMGKRHHGHVFLPSKFVFPGGGIDPLDRKMSVAVPLNPVAEAKLMAKVKRPTRTYAQALALAAIRETFEETGILLGKKADAAPNAPGGPWTEFAKHLVSPDLSSVHFICRAITPPRRARRYDTRFFTADVSAIAHKIDGVIGPETELTELIWQPLADIKRLDLLAITEIALEDLHARIEAGFGHDLPVPFYRMLHGKRSRELL